MDVLWKGPAVRVSGLKCRNYVSGTMLILRETTYKRNFIALGNVAKA